MKRILSTAIVFISSLFIAGKSFAQPIDSIRFFTDESILEMDLNTDIKALQTEKGKDVFQPAGIKMKFSDGTLIEEAIQAGARGNFRRNYCRIPPMMLQFRNPTSPRLHPLGKLKLVIGCGTSSTEEELVLKEYITYKLYNILTEKSFRVRLAKTAYSDSRGKIKPFTQYSFFIEDDGDMARRNNYRKKTHGQYLTEATDRETMTLVAIFQYMIGNTDWSVPNEHNVELVFSRENELLPPIVVPYDFDYCGLVDASYAVPADVIGTEKVTERVYRGFPRQMEEVQATLDIFRAKKEAILSTVRDFNLLSERTRKGMVNYLEDFFRKIESKAQVQSIFIDNARTN